jgi:glycerate kinase
MSDGGDGFGEIIGGMMGAEPISVATTDSADRPHTAKFWFDDKTKTAVIEAAQVNGLALLPRGKYHPFELDTFGLGRVFQEASEAGAMKGLVGIGGSSTNDAGLGLARALGWQFFDERGGLITKWTEMDQIRTFAPPPQRLDMEITVAVDVQNPLLGPNGCSRIYGPQKELREQDMEKAEACLANLARLTTWQFDHDYAAEPGAGAAGGLGFGLRVFMNGKFVSGADLFADAARLDQRLATADVVISGEGAIDAQSLMGKGVGAIFQRARDAGVRRIGLAGCLEAQFAADPDLQLLAIVPKFASLEEAKAEPAKYLRLLASEAAKKHGSA